MEWQPIETAPDSLEYILVTDGARVWPSYMSEEGPEIIEMGDRGGDQYKGVTHWMPLPLPPAQGIVTEGGDSSEAPVSEAN